MSCLCAWCPDGTICLECAVKRGLGRSFDANGDVKDPTTKLAKCRLCYRSIVRDGLCLDHFEMRRRRAVA